MEHAEPQPQSPLAPDCLRTRFLEELLGDQEHGRLANVDHYLARFPGIAPFVRSEYAAFCIPDPPASLTTPDLPDTCGRYRLVRAIGEGGMGLVHEAFDTELGRRVVIKTLRSDLAASAQARERLRREARVLGRLEHAHLAKVIDLFEADGRTHLVMPFHEGRTLAECIQEARRRSELAIGGATSLPTLGSQVVDRAQALRRILTFFVHSAAALQSAHKAGVVHRDLKPQNLMVAPDGMPVVLDFGLALPEADERLTLVGEIMGTPLYMAPEQIEGQKADACTDVYALGVCLYETLTLVHPIAVAGGRAAVFHRILQGDPVPPRRHQPRLTRDLEAVVLHAMEREPRRRYQDMDAFARDLQRVLDLEPTDARPVSGIDLAWRRLRRRPFVSLLAVLVIVASSLAIWNQVRVEDIKGLSEKIEGLISRGGRTLPSDEIRDYLREIKDRSPTHPGLHLLYPRGRVLSSDRFEWRGTNARDASRPRILFCFTFSVEVFDGDAVVARWSYEQPTDTRYCRSTPPKPLALVPDRTYRWRISLERYEAVGEQGADPAELARSKRLTVDQMRKYMPSVDTEFRVAASPVPAVRPEFGTLAERVRSLLDQGFAADVLVLLEEKANAVSPQMPHRRRNELVLEAAVMIGDEVLAAEAQAAIDGKARLR